MSCRDPLLMAGGNPQLNIEMANKDQGKLEMIGGKSTEENTRVIRHCKKQKKRLLTTDIDSLPDDLVLEILVNLPAQDIYNSAMLVHRKWYRMVHSSAFIHAQLQNSPHGLLLTTLGPDCMRTTLGIRQGRVEIYKLCSTDTDTRGTGAHGNGTRITLVEGVSVPRSACLPVPCACRAVSCPCPTHGHPWPKEGPCFVIYKSRAIIYSQVRASCNGLILQECVGNQCLFITNPITRQDFGIPPHPRDCPGVSFYPVLGYSPSTMEYKVVGWYQALGIDRNPTKCVILTVGVDKSWREVCTQHISKSFFTSHALLTQGFIHWYSDTHVWTLNLETEVMTQAPFPRDVNNSSRYYMLKPSDYEPRICVKNKYCLSTMGKSLSVLVWVSQLCWDIWEMRSETGEWKKVGHIDLEAQRRRLYWLRRRGREEDEAMVLIPVGWLEYREVLVFFFASPTKVFIVYNVRTQEIDSFELDSQTGKNDVYLHTNSLEWLTPRI